MASESDGSSKSIQLIPFIHQVAGRSSILQLDSSRICKPLVDQELHFYHNVPVLLKPFIPSFKGEIEVTFIRENNDYVRLVARSPDNYQNNILSSENCCKLRVNPNSGNVEIQQNTLSNNESKFEDREGCNGGQQNPWLLRCHKKPQLWDGNAQKYIVLENLTAALKCPCVLDLKMGIRQYGDDASQAKIKSKMARSASTTSANFGLRLCGMQVYQVDGDKFVCYDKFHGRTLKEDSFRHILYSFLFNGRELRKDVIASILTSLRELNGLVKKLDSFRFYCCSLLVLYDGFRSNDNSETTAAIKLIDFAHSAFTNKETLGKKNTVEHPGPDPGLLFGLKNLQALLEELINNGSSPKRESQVN